MYTEDYDKKEFPYRNFFLKVVIIIVTLLILVWIFTSVFKSNTTEEVEGFTNEVFYNNLDMMKSSALTYYVEDKLPVKNNKSKKLTLEKMIKSKIIKPLKDKDNNLCDQKKSFIKITKKQDEYLLKIDLTCGEDSDYIISHLNHYSYCDKTYLCEKKEEIEEKVNEVEENNEKEDVISNDSSSDGSKVIKKSTNNKVEKKSAKKKNSNSTNKGTISVIDTTNDNYLYEYAKTTNAKFSSWSLWSNWQRVSCSTTSITCDVSNVSCLKELKRYNRKEKIGTYFKEYNNSKNTLLNSSNITKNVCSNYDYVEVDGSIYRISNGATSNYQSINNVTSTTASNVGNWLYKGRSSYINPPSDTYNTHYVLVGADYSECNNTCVNNPKYYYDKYIYSGNIIRVPDYDVCNFNVNKNVAIYTTNNQKVHFERYENLYGTVCYKSERSRKLISMGTTTKKWSSYNDKKLLDSGYYYTGKKKRDN